MDVGLNRQHMEKIQSSLLTAVGVRVGHIEDTVAVHDGALRTLQSKMKTLK